MQESKRPVMGHVSFGPRATALDIDVRNSRGEVGKPGNVDVRQGGVLPPVAVNCECDPRETVKPPQHTFKLILPVDVCMASIEMDGKPMKGVTRIDLSVAANELTTIKLAMRAHVEVEGELRETEIVHVERTRDV